jgi:hypothetical protein
MFASCVLVAVIARDLFFAAKKSGGGKESETAHFQQMRGDVVSGAHGGAWSRSGVRAAAPCL